MLNLQLPEPTDFPASVFDQNGTLIFMGPRENCELLAEEVGGLYCWNINGKPIIRKNFEVKMRIFNFSANSLDFGDWAAPTQDQAQELFAQDSGYKSWSAMVEQAEEFGGNNVEVYEVRLNKESV